MIRKSSIFSLVLSMLTVSLPAHAAQEPAYTPQPASLVAERTYEQAQPVSFAYESFSLHADSGSLVHDMAFRFALVNKLHAQPMPSNMVNTTGDLVEAFRLLPNGEHFAEPAQITVPYDFHRLPLGYKAKDVFTFYYDEEQARWNKLERIAIDTVSHTITSLTTHFTDFANAIIKVPEMPEASAFVPTAMTDLPDVNPLQGIPMIAAPQANNRGTAELTYPIELPQGRRGMQPNIDLHYSSAAGNGILGVGWSMQVPAITIDTRWGVPRYDLAVETESYLLNGEQLVWHDEMGKILPLPYQALSFLPRKRGDVRFYARDARNQDIIIRHGTDARNYYWTVIDRSGTTYYYGYNPFEDKRDPMAILFDSQGHAAEWMLTLAIDIYGNYIQYDYLNDNNEELYLERITYTGNIHTHINPIYSVVLDYRDSRSDIIRDGRLGLLRQTKKTLCSINVFSKKKAVASYAMEYDVCSASTLYKTRLKAIVKRDAFEIEQCDPSNSRPSTWVASDLQFDDKTFDRETNLLNIDATERSQEVPGSRTCFSYYDAVSANQLFAHATPNSSLPDLGRNLHLNTGGGGAFAFGLGGGTTGRSIGVNSNLQYGAGLVKSAIIDLNGDGLPDYVFERLGDVYYKRQLPDNTFADSVLVPGIKNLIRDQSFSYSLGIQASFGVKLNGSPASFNNSFTDVYFADINNDHLPDLITDKAIYCNHLDANGNPSFTEQVGESVSVSTTTCERSIYRDGEVDSRLDCKVVKRLLKSIEWGYLYSSPLLIKDENRDNGYKRNITDDNKYENEWENYEVEKILEHFRSSQSRRVIPIERNTKNDDEVLPLNSPIASSQGLVYSELQGEVLMTYPVLDSILAECENKGLVVEETANGIRIYELDEDCTHSDSLPQLDVVRVWVSNVSGTITLSSLLQFSSDMADERQQSNYADGVKYYIQLSSGVSVSADGTLASTRDSVIYSATINAHDNLPKNLLRTLSVSPGDILMFRLSSLNNHSFDKMDWRQHITCGHQVWDSKDDFFCWPEGNFYAVQDGEVVVDVDVKNLQSHNLRVKLKKNGSTLDSSFSNQDSIHLHAQTSVSRGDSVFVQVKSFVEPQWSKIKVSPTLLFMSDFAGFGHIDTIRYHLGSTIEDGPSHISFPSDNNDAKYRAYKALFGVLHKGWGQFSYNNANNDEVIHLADLSNFGNEMVAMLSDSSSLDAQLSSWHNIDSMRTVLDNNSAWEYLDTFNALSDNRRWVAMQADLQSHRWVTVGNVGALGELEHSVCLQPVAETLESIMGTGQQGSFLPSGAEYDVRHLRKSTFSYSPSLSLSISNFSGGQNTSGNASANQSPWRNVGNLHVSGGYTKAVSDFMDLNGDGFPDFVGCPTKSFNVQYTNPWGGLGKLTANTWEPFITSNYSEGAGYSGSLSTIRNQTSNNYKNNRTYNFFEAGEEASQSMVNITYMDVNGDGLPDLLHQKDSSVRYNLGYSFSPKYHIPKMQINTALNEHGVVSDMVNAGLKEEDFYGFAGLFANLLNLSISFNLEQYSIGGGLSSACSKNSTTYRMLDVNGDGYLDLVEMTTDGNLKVQLNRNNRILENAVTMQQNVDHSSTTYNFTTNASFTITAGIFEINPQVVPISVAYSFSNMEWMDMNGDGFVDLVVMNTAHDSPTVYYNANGTTPVNLIKQVTNPTGQNLNFEYMQSEPTIYHAGRSWLLKSVCDSLPRGYEIDARAEMSKGHSYEGAYFDVYERSDYGYQQVSTAEYRNLSNQDIYRVLTQEYSNDYFINHGELVKDSLSDGVNPFVVNTYELLYADENNKPTDMLCLDYLLHRNGVHQRTYYYEGDSVPGIITASLLEYDELYNLIARHDSGDVCSDRDDYHQAISYMSNPYRYNNLISLPEEEVVLDMNLSTLRHSSTLYDSYGSPTRVTFHNTNSAVTEIQYDIYGNVMQVQSPENLWGERIILNYAYDLEAQTYPVMICNQFGEMQLSRYNISFGLPEVVIDPTGQAIRYRYDPMGRLTDVFAPNETGVPTVHYSYVLPFHNVRWSLSYQSPDYSYPHVSKLMSSWGSLAGAERTFYDARGAELQKKVWQLVDGQYEWVVQGGIEMDEFGRNVGITTPFVSGTSISSFDSVGSVSAARTILKYDILDRKRFIFHPDGTSQEFQYGFASDGYGCMRFSHGFWNENNVYSEQLLSPQGWIIQQNNPLNQTTRFTYNALGELLHVVDADGYATSYEYDLQGQLTRRTHPDAGMTTYVYDPMGNVVEKMTENLRQAGSSPIYYDYWVNRPTDVIYPLHPDMDVAYYYYSTGRLAKVEDATGYEEYDYDLLGNVRHSRRAIFVPTDYDVFLFEHDYQYDPFGRMCRIVYPDGDAVDYQYSESGQLLGVTHTFHHQTFPLVEFEYDEQGRKTLAHYGNNVDSYYEYSQDRNWLTHSETILQNYNMPLSDLDYYYDAVGNIVAITQQADSAGDFGGPYATTYSYNDLNRLTSATCSGSSLDYDMHVSLSPTGRLGNKFLNALLLDTKSNLTYGYDVNGITHQPRTMFDSISGYSQNLFWDANGNLQQIVNCHSGDLCVHLWDEENRMRAILGPNFSGYYGYDANGERVYKLTGATHFDALNASGPSYGIIFDEITVYPSPYIVLSEHGYTKHFYAGGERIATLIGDGGIQFDYAQMDSQRQSDITRAFEHLEDEIAQLYHSDCTPNENIDGQFQSELQYCEDFVAPIEVDVSYYDYLLGAIVDDWSYFAGISNEVYFTHSDHLGSASWITDGYGDRIQYIHYAPYGEFIANQQVHDYDERFKFTGKERDAESGYDYFGARHYDHRKGIWNSVDPLADKYIHQSPYIYCNGNPVKFVDPDGEDVWELSDDGTIKARIPDKTQDAIAMKGISISFDYGTIDMGFNGMEYNNTNYSYFQFSEGKENEAAAAFKFLADNSSVEYALVNTEKNVSGVYTNHKKDDVYTGFAAALVERLTGAKMINNYHSHTNGTMFPSGLKDGKGDMRFAKNKGDSYNYYIYPAKSNGIIEYFSTGIYMNTLLPWPYEKVGTISPYVRQTGIPALLRKYGIKR